MKMRVPTNKEYIELLRLTGNNDRKMHWTDIYSWVDDTENNYNLDPSCRALRGYYSARYWGDTSASFRSVRLGFRPACELGIDALPSDTKERDTIVIGTLYMGGRPVKVPQDPTYNGDIVNYIPDSKLEMRPPLDDVAYQVTGFCVSNGIVVADRVLLKNISYNDIVTAIGLSCNPSTSLSNEAGCVRVDTPAGAIYVTAKGDDAYPGVYIDLRRPDFDNDLLLGMVEFHPDEKTIVTHVYGDGMGDEPTDRIVHTRIEDFFALTEDKNEEMDKRAKAEQCLIDNGIDPEEAATVLQALGYILMDKELYPTEDGGNKE